MNNDITECENIRKSRSEIATRQQQSAADPNFSVWVEASAGTGKTKVLTDRVLRILLSGVEPQRLLCLTYTKAAAVQMNERLSEYLGKWAVIPLEDLKQNIQKLIGEDISSSKMDEYVNIARILFAKMLDTPGGIKIQTIHSFCQEILKRFPLEAGVSPYFEVLDDRSKENALNSIKKELLDHDKTQDIPQAIDYFTHNLSEYSFPKIMEHIIDNRIKIAALLKKHGSLNNFLHSLSNHLQVNENADENAIKLLFMQSIDWQEMQLNMTAWACGGKKDAEKITKLQQILSHKIDAGDYDLYCSVFLTSAGEPLSEKYMAGKEAKKKDENILTRAYKEAERIQKNNKKLNALRLYSATKNFLIIAQSLNQKYDDFKRQTARLDYDDLILLTRNLLSDPSSAAWVLYKLDGGIDHILLDEAQDTSPEQWDIIKYLSDEFFAGFGSNKLKRTIFAVGDRKQSIFSFQGADPDKFDAMSKYFQYKAGADFKNINLEVSFRSAPAVLQAVNQIFAEPAISKGVVAPAEEINHLPFRAGEFGHVEIWEPFIAQNKDKAREDSEFLPPMEMKHHTSVRTKLARAIAERIKAMVNETSQTEHPLNFNDFMVLIRKRDAFVEEFIRACKKHHVNISGADKMILTEQIAVQDLISLGKFLLLPNDDLSLAEVLKSPIFGLTDDDLMTLCFDRKKAPLWTKLGDNPKYAEIYGKLQSLFDKLDFIRPYELYNLVLTKWDARHNFICRMGLEVEDSLDEFMNLAIAFEQQNIPSLQGFITWIGQSDVSIKRQTEQKNINAVRLMTVHGSKGLQAPIVFLPDTISLKSSNCEQNVLLDDDSIYYPLNSSLYEDNCLQIKEYNDRKADEEYRRLLYVALTRAEDQMIICGYSNSDSINPQSWYSLCKNSLLANGVTEDKIIEVTTPEIIKKKTYSEQMITPDMPDIEDWIEKDVADEDTLSKPYHPSKLEDEEELDSSSPLEENGNFYRRGTIIHKLLQYLPQNLNNADEAIDVFLQKNASDFSNAQQCQIKNEVLALLQDENFALIFGPDSHSEVPIVGQVNNKIISAQLDKLIILPDKIMIVDFKTNRPAAQDVSSTPQTYINQLSLYAELIKKIYPNLPVETYILWTNEARLMRVA